MLHTTRACQLPPAILVHLGFFCTCRPVAAYVALSQNETSCRNLIHPLYQPVTIRCPALFTLRTVVHPNCSLPRNPNDYKHLPTTAHMCPLFTVHLVNTELKPVSNDYSHLQLGTQPALVASVAGQSSGTNSTNTGASYRMIITPLPSP